MKVQSIYFSVFNLVPMETQRSFIVYKNVCSITSKKTNYWGDTGKVKMSK